MEGVAFHQTHLSLSSLLAESGLFESLSLSSELAEVLLSESPGFSQGGGVGKVGGVRCKRFHGSWWLLLLLLLLMCCCMLTLSLCENTELAAVRDSTHGNTRRTQVKFRSQQLRLANCLKRPFVGYHNIHGVKTHLVLDFPVLQKPMN